MRRIKFKNFSPLTLEVYEYFRNQPGSDHIAKPTTIEVILDICEKEKPKRILEMGGGLGTISYIMLKYSDAFVDIYEDNDFCLSRLQEKISLFRGRFRIMKDYHELPPAKEY